MKKKSIALFEYIIAFLGFCMMYIFIVPISDTFFFARDYENSISSFVENALNYGNGRFIGNAIGFAFSHRFLYAFLLIAATLTLIVFLMNRLFFNGDSRTVIPIALVFGFPSSGAFSEVYSHPATFANYVIPIVLVFAALCLIKNSEKLRIKILPAAAVFVLFAASCLFSENTTISVFTLTVLLAVYSYIKNRKLNILNIVGVLGAAVGGLAMVLLPKLTGAEHNLDYYRETADSLSSLATIVIASFSAFSDIFTSYVLPIIMISAALIFILIKESEANARLKSVLIFVLAFFPAEALFYTFVLGSIRESVYLTIFQGCIVALYALAVFVSILCLKKSDFKALLVEIYILVLSSIGPMLLANKYGYRTFYLPFVIMFSFSLVLLAHIIKEIPEERIKGIKAKNTDRIFACAFIAAFICLSFTVFLQSVYNYNFYVARTDYIAQQINNRAEEIEVPVVPCRGISPEDENPNYVDSILYHYSYPEGYKCTVKVAAYNYDSSDIFYHLLETNPVSAVISATQNLNYKNPKIIDELTNVNK